MLSLVHQAKHFGSQQGHAFNILVRSIQRNFITNQAKTLHLVVTSLRIDRILATGLGTGRRKVEYNLLKGLVKLNGKTITKKSVEVTEGDIIDQFSLEKTTDNVYSLDRVHLLEIGETTKKGNYKIALDRTRSLQVEKDQYRQSFA